MNPLAFIMLGPLVAAAATMLLRRNVPILTLMGSGVGLVASLRLLFDVSAGLCYSLLFSGLPGLALRLTGTPLSALLSVVIAVVSTLVLLYAIGYMKEERDKSRFFATMSFFVAAMQTLVLAGDWVLFLAAWEIIGFSSYLLIGFWFRQPAAVRAATRAFLYTRTADLGLYAAVFILIAHTRSSDIAITLTTGGSTAVVVGLLLLLAAIGKSAQIPLHNWLALAMAAPTPVSALLHSATLVAAGTILLIRVTPMLPPVDLLVIGLIGGLTTVIASLIALAETDLKRTLAASTSSQYGLMWLALGAGAPLAALLHLIAHAAIKSSLFLGAGVFQRARRTTDFSHLQDVGRTKPRIFFLFALGAVSLIGIPPFSGFFSKDAIIAALLTAPHAYLLAPFALVGTLLTGAYMARALRILWESKGVEKDGQVPGLVWMGVGMGCLIFFAATLDAAFKPISVLLGQPIPFSHSAQVLGLAAALGGSALGWFVAADRLLGPVLGLAQRGFIVNGGFDTWLVSPILAFARQCERFDQWLYQGAIATGQLGLGVGRCAAKFDTWGIDSLIFGLANKIRLLARAASTLQSGLVYRELAITSAGVALLFVVLVTALLNCKH